MAEKRVIELEVKESGLSSLKEQLAAAKQNVQDLADRFGASSKQVADAADQVRSLEKEIKQTNKTLKSVSFEGKFNAISGSITGVLNGLQAFQGSLGLIGVEGKNVESALLKMQSVMALTDGIEGVFAAQTSFKKLQTLIGDAASSAVKGFQNMTTAGKAFAVTGIGLLITGLGLVITYWDDIRKAVGDVSEEEQKLAEYRRQYAAEQDKQVAEESKGFATLIAQLKASNVGSKERSGLITEINQKYGTTLKNLSDEAEFQNQLNQELANYLTYQQAKFRLQKNEEAIVRNLETQSKLKRELVQAEKDLAKAIQDGAGKTRTTLEEGVAVQIAVNQEASNAAERASERIKKNTKELADAENRFENYGKAAIYASGQIDKLTYSGKKYVEQNTEVKTSTEKVTKEITKQADTVRDTNQEMLDAGAAFGDAAKKRRDKTTQEMSDEEQARYDASVYWQNLKLDFAKQKTDEEIALEIKKRETTLQLATSAFSALGDLAGSFHTNNEKDAKKQFKIQKAFNLASAITNTALAITGALTAGGNPIKLATGQQFIEAAIAAVTGAAAITKITNTQFESASSGGGSGAPSQSSGASAGAGNVITPNFNIVGNAQATNPLAGLGGQPLQAYVVSGDVTTAQSLDRNRINYATFG